ncbi:MAG: filamentous hemagglutinin N-terminal domain-containing protein, partial [Gammaproteobacteria bacterium]|nr:filamentous hemagglutinin N-terminal domain-containing protein [Gammaproteobacteria bacterium]
MDGSSLLKHAPRGMRRAGITAFSLCISLFTTTAAYAGPEGENIIRGAGEVVRPDARTTVVNQQTHRVVINWQSFNVNVDEQVQFNQPTSSSTALNRILDQNPSQIFGALNANGRIMLINPQGIVFGETASVNVNALIASGLDVNPDEFMAGGKLRFQAPEGEVGGLIINRGLIQAATGGSVSLIGGAVQNSG